MKDLPLSVLSRGCGQFVHCEGEQNGRLDVCFTPEDYYIWKAHGPLLRLSTSGCVLTGPESTLPKTFSTRRGALLLYSQGLVTLESCPSNLYDRKDYGQCSAHPVQQGETASIKLTQSILNYSGIHESHHGLLTSALPALHPHPSDVKYSGTLRCQYQQHEQIQQLPHSVFLAQQESHCEDGHKRTIDVFLQMPSVTANSSQQIQNNSGSNMEAMTSEEDKDFIMNPLRTRAEQIQQEDASNASKSNNDHGKNYEVKTSPKQSNTRRSEQGGFLPPLKAAQPFKSETNKVHSDRVRKSFKEQCAEHLPSIEETGAGITRGLSHKPDIKPLRNTTGPQLPFLPRLVPDKCEEKAVNLHRKHETWSCRIIQGQVSENSYNISLNTEEEYFAPLGILTGKRGPGRQSSSAFVQKLHEESSDPSNTEAVRGVLPLELRDLNGRSVGSLILGPDGEIIQLSMFDNIQHSAKEQALEVVSAKGETLPWIVMLQPEHNLTDKDEAVQMIDIKQDHCFNKVLFDLERSGSGPGSVKTFSDPDAMENSDLKDSESVIKTRTKSPKLAEDLVPRLSTLDGTEVETESREDKKDIRSGQLQQPNMSTNKPNQMSHNNINPNDAALQNAVKDSKKLTNKKGAEDGPISNKEKRKDTRSTPNHQVASGKEREDRITAHDSLPFSGPNNENKTPATNTNKQSQQNVALKGKETKTRDIKKTNDHVEDVSSDKKKRRGKLKYKDIQSDLLATDGTNSSQDTEEEDTKQRNVGLSSKQKHINTKSDVIEECADTDPFIIKEPRLNSDKHSRSLRSLRSGASGSSLKNSNSQKSLSSLCEGGTLQGTFQGTNVPMFLSRSRLSSCSTVTIQEERLMLNPTKSAEVVAEQSIRDQEDKATVLEAEKVKIQRQEEERKMREQEEEQRQQQQKEELEQRMRSELQNERQRRAEEIRIKKQTEEEERQRREEEEQRREQREQERREREIRRQQERKRQKEHFQRKREEEEQRRKAEADLLNLLEEKRLQEENFKLQEMTVSERAEYQRNKREENDKREREAEERRRKEEDAALLAAEKAKMEEELLAREMALLHQRLSFKRGLVVESEGLEKTQGISRPWTYSYFTLLQLLSLSNAGKHHT